MSRSTDLSYHADQPVLEYGTSLDDAEAAVILIHGRGDSAYGIMGLAGLLRVSGLLFLAPQARGNTWYPNSFLAPLDDNEPGISSGVHVIGTLVDNLGKVGLSRERIMIVGFSQGGCLAAEFVARNPDRYGGLAVLSGGLIGNGEQTGGVQPPDDKLFDYGGNLAGSPIYLGCSDIDPHIPLERVEKSAAVFGDLGGDVTMRIFPGMGHTINDEEISELRLMIHAVTRAEGAGSEEGEG